MSRFWSDLRANIAALPSNLRSGLHPGAGPGSEAPGRLMRRNFLLHLHPVRVTARALEPTATFGLGLITLTLFIALCASGVLLMIYYVPTTSDAYSSTQDIEHAVTFGGFVRALHRWTAHAMVLAAFLHLVRVLFTRAYVGRELNWEIGLGLFLTTLGLAFTGYLLPWDQLSFWAVSVSANLLDHVPWLGQGLKRMLLGGDRVGQAALIRFYTLHVALLPGLAIGLMVLHLWRIRKDGGLAREHKGGEESVTVPAWPHMVLREAVIVIGLMAVMFAIATFVSAPLGGAPDVHNPSNPEKTPWYFLWLQEMVSFSAPVGGFVFPGALLAALCLLPFLDRDHSGVGRWPAGRVWLGVPFVVAIVALISFESIFQDPGIASRLASGPPWLGDLLNPATGMLLVSAVVFAAVGRAVGSTRAAFLAGAAVLLVAVIGFGVTGWCRGPGWVFYWPFEEWPIAY